MGHLRLAGLKHWNGKAVITVLPIRLGPVGSSPIVESFKDLEGADLMRHIDTSKKCQLHSDGAKSWPAMVNRQNYANLESFHVSYA